MPPPPKKLYPSSSAVVIQGQKGVINLVLFLWGAILAHFLPPPNIYSAAAESMWSGAETGFQCEAGGSLKVVKMESSGITPQLPIQCRPRRA